MLKNLFIICIGMLFSISAVRSEDYTPYGKFDWTPEQCIVKEGAKDGAYGCYLFLKTDDPRKPRYIFSYRDTWLKGNTPDHKEWTPKISLDPETKFRDGKLSIKLDFSKIDPAKVSCRAAFKIIPKIEMEKGKTYEATIYLKSAEPDKKIRITMMGNYYRPKRKRPSQIYRFYPFTTSTMWKPYKVTLNMKRRRDAVSADIQSLLVQIDSPGIYWVGGITIKPEK